MDIDRKKQWWANALGMTLAEVEAIEWQPLEFEKKGYIDPRKEHTEVRPAQVNGTRGMGHLQALLGLIDAEQAFWDARVQDAGIKAVSSAMFEDGGKA